MPKQPNCPNCRVALPQGATFCHNCGVDVPGRERPEDDRKLCSGCLESFHKLALKQYGDRLLCPDCLEEMVAREEEQKSRQTKSKTGRWNVLHVERQDERFEVPGSFVKMQTKGVLTSIFHGRKQDVGKLVDLSRGGGQCITRETFKIGDRLALELRTPKADTPVCLTGVVVWTRFENKDQQRMGIRFDDLSREAQDFIDELGLTIDPGQETG
jgi:hypothetical protein